MTRFWINFDKAIEFVLMALKNFKGSEIYVPEMENFKILDLAKAINSKLRIKYTGKNRKLSEKIILDLQFVDNYTLYNYFKILLIFSLTSLILNIPLIFINLFFFLL